MCPAGSASVMFIVPDVDNIAKYYEWQTLKTKKGDLQQRFNTNESSALERLRQWVMEVSTANT